MAEMRVYQGAASCRDCDAFGRRELTAESIDGCRKIVSQKADGIGAALSTMIYLPEMLCARRPCGIELFRCHRRHMFESRSRDRYHAGYVLACCAEPCGGSRDFFCVMVVHAGNEDGIDLHAESPLDRKFDATELVAYEKTRTLFAAVSHSVDDCMRVYLCADLWVHGVYRHRDVGDARLDQLADKAGKKQSVRRKAERDPRVLLANQAKRFQDGIPVRKGVAGTGDADDRQGVEMVSSHLESGERFFGVEDGRGNAGSAFVDAVEFPDAVLARDVASWCDGDMHACVLRWQPAEKQGCACSGSCCTVFVAADDRSCACFSHIVLFAIIHFLSCCVSSADGVLLLEGGHP